MKNKQKNPLFQILDFASDYKSKMIIATVISVLSVFLGIVPYITMGKILIYLIDGNVRLERILVLAGLTALSLIIEKVLYSISTWISHKVAFGTLCSIRCSLVDKLEHTSMGYIQNRESGSFKQNMIDLVDRLEDALAHLIPEVIPNVILPIIVLLYLFVLDWRIAFASLASIFIGAVTWSLMMGKNAMDIFQLTQEGTENMNSTIVEYVNGMEIIKAFNQTASSMKRYENAVIKYRDALVRWFHHVWPYLSVYGVVTPATIAFVLPVSGILLFNGAIDMHTLITCLVLSLGIVQPIMKIVSFTDHINELYTANTKIQEILNAPELVQSSKFVSINNNSIELKNVSFGYGEQEVLHDISFKVNAGTTTAIVGSSGSGKSTITKLIARFWDVDKGQILIGNMDIKDIPFEQLMSYISYVSQDNFLPNITIRENIRMGKPNASDEEICLASKKACCDEFIRQLPNGYDTKVGDAGDKLSGGERQRIAIARAIIKNAPIVILDEATSAIDPENEYLIQKSIDELTKGKTLIIVAHRLSTIMYSQQIIVVDKGEKIAYGSHAELLESCPIYKSMWDNHIGASGWSIRKGVSLCGE